MSDPKPKANPRRFYSGLEVMRHYIPDYGKEEKVLTIEEEAEQAAARIMSKVEIKLGPPLGPEPSKSEAKKKEQLKV
ncbi:MAG: hypothetical protein OXH84_00195 [Gammaproteobacteria bacterium]|nr:hypothetical protein [Gammaproteobacteria bacterium]